jgi:trehalose 6-phosphate phosphatase
VISGRSRDDVAGRLRDIPIALVSGNHGLEPWAEQRQYVRQVKGWIDRLGPRLASHAGVSIEDKTYSISIHYRAAADRKQALRAIHHASNDLRGARLIGGKLVVNILPDGAPTKGAALERARRQLACEKALYVGDDDTDEDAFGIVDRTKLLGVRVGATERTRARYCLTRQRDIDRLLRQLILLRPAGRSKVA